MTEKEFLKRLLEEMIDEGSLTEDEGSEILRQLTKEAGNENSSY